MLEVRTIAFSSHPYAGGTNEWLLSESTPYVGGINSCFLNQPLRWWSILALEVQPYAGGTDAAGPYSSADKSC